ncbi:MAG: ATP-binding cassette domain-containing protein, partial [Gemmatimonadota bacterium]
MERTTERLLVVDDSDLDRQILQAALEERGFGVEVAANGRQALEALARERFDLVFLDLMMPEMDGFETLRQLKRDPVLSQVPVIVLSSLEDTGSVVRCIDAGAVDYLPKPFELALLTVRTEAALAPRRAGSLQAVTGAGPVARRTYETRQPIEVTVDVAAEAGGEPIGVGGFLRCLGRWFRPYRWRLAMLLLPLLVVTGFEAGHPLSFKFITDDALLQHNLPLLLFIIGALLAGVVLAAACGILLDYLVSRLGTALLNDLRLHIFQHLQRLSMGFYGRSQSGDITARFNTDLAAVENTLMLTLPSATMTALQLLVSVSLLFVLEWRLSIFALIGLFLSFRSERIVEPRAAATSYRMKQQQAEIAAVLQENVSSQPLVKAFRLQAMVVDRFRRQMVRFFRTSSRAFFLDYLVESVPNLSILVFGLLTVSAGALLTYYGHMTLGALVSFQALLTSVIASVGELTWSMPHLIHAGAGMQRIQELLDEHPEVADAPGAARLPRLRGEIAFAGVSFGYRPDHLNLKGVDLRLRAGQTVALVGPSGCGKSTVLNLILRFFDPQEGTVSFDGVDLRTVTQDSLRSQISIVLQEAFLLNTSVRENIRMGRLDATDQEVEDAARTVGLHELISGLPDGYDTAAGERGNRFSGGQRQRLAIARAILSDPAILLLDEATSALDPPTAGAINRTIEEVGKGRTVIAVTHRLESAITADAICVFRDGRVVEQGRHRDLLNLKGAYYAMWQEFGLELTQEAMVGGAPAAAEPAVEAAPGGEGDLEAQRRRELETRLHQEQLEVERLQSINQRWAQLAGTDRLTGLPNKVAFLQALVPQQLQQAQR